MSLNVIIWKMVLRKVVLGGDKGRKGCGSGRARFPIRHCETVKWEGMVGYGGLLPTLRICEI